MIFRKVLKRETNKYDSGCIMLDVEFPQLMDIQSQIRTADLYFGDNVGMYGLEDEPHVTILFGISPTLSTIYDVKHAIYYIDPPKKVFVSGLSVFKNDSFDVLKLNIDNKEEFKKMNRILKSVLPFHPSPFDYEPHLTVAYLNKGLGDIYKEKIGDINFELEVDSLCFTNAEEERFNFY